MFLLNSRECEKNEKNKKRVQQKGERKEIVSLTQKNNDIKKMYNL